MARTFKRLVTDCHALGSGLVLPLVMPWLSGGRRRKRQARAVDPSQTMLPRSPTGATRKVRPLLVRFRFCRGRSIA